MIDHDENSLDGGDLYLCRIFLDQEKESFAATERSTPNAQSI